MGWGWGERRGEGGTEKEVNGSDAQVELSEQGTGIRSEKEGKIPGEKNKGNGPR